MVKPSLNRLKVFREESPEAAPPDIGNVASLSKVLAAFCEATGWSARFHCGPRPTDPTESAWSAPVNPGVGTTPGPVRLALVRSASAASEPDTPPEAVRKLAAALADMLGELVRTRQALSEREAELAAGVPLALRPDEPKHLAVRLQSVLRGGAQAVGCRAAALYLLDEGTTCLKLRSSWGLPPERLADPARPLHGALADLEAMLGHAVVLEDTALLPHWHPPEDYPSAACVPVATSTTILGTMWVFCETRRDFNDRETSILEVVAGRLAADLEREMLLEEGIRGARLKHLVAAVERLQCSQLPSVPLLSETWDIAGWTAQAGSIGGEFYDWFCLPDGSMAAVLAAVQGQGIEAALAASTLRATLRSHAQYHNNADALLRQVNATVWTSSSGDMLASTFCGFTDLRGGRIRFAQAGGFRLVVVRPNGWESLTQPAPPVGEDPETSYAETLCQLEPGEILVVLPSVDKPAIPAEDSQGPTIQGPSLEVELARALAGRLELPARDLAAIVPQCLESQPQPAAGRPGAVLVIKRRNP